MINIHFFNIIIYFLARIDPQAEIYHSRLSKQDNKQNKKQKTKKQKTKIESLFFHDRAFPLR